MQEGTAIAGLRWKPGEVEKIAREMAESGLRQYYETKKQEFLSFHGAMLESFLEQGQVLSEMRRRSSRTLHWLSLETGLERVYLENLADFWETFQGELPRKDIALPYYLRAAQAIKVIGDSWEEKEEIVGQVQETAVELLRTFEPAQYGPQSLASSLARLFGILNLGEKPFAGVAISSEMSEEELKRVANDFHPLVRPLFLEHARQIQRKEVERQAEIQPEAVSPPIRDIASMVLTLTYRIQNPPEDIEKLVRSVTENLQLAGLPVELVSHRSYTPFQERLRLLHRED